MSAKEYWIIYYTLFRKEVVRVLRIWAQTLLPPVITMSLYFLIFGKIVGSRIGTMHDFSYMEYITPGLIIMAVINNAYANVVGSFFGSRFNHSIEEILVSPMTSHIVILGYISGGVARGLFVGVLVSVVAFLFGGLSYIYSVPLVILGALLCGALFALGGLLNGIFSQKFDDTTIFPTFILTPLIYLGGVFYSLELLPDFWQNVALVNPLFYIIDFVRFSFLGETFINPWYALSMIILFTLILYYLAWYLLSKGIRLKA